MSFTNLPINSFIPLYFITPVCTPGDSNNVNVFVSNQLPPPIYFLNGPTVASEYETVSLLSNIPGPYQGILFNKPSGAP